MRSPRLLGSLGQNRENDDPPVTRPPRSLPRGKFKGGPSFLEPRLRLYLAANKCFLLRSAPTLQLAFSSHCGCARLKDPRVDNMKTLPMVFEEFRAEFATCMFD